MRKQIKAKIKYALFMLKLSGEDKTLVPEPYSKNYRSYLDYLERCALNSGVHLPFGAKAGRRTSTKRWRRVKRPTPRGRANWLSWKYKEARGIYPLPRKFIKNVKRR